MARPCRSEAPTAQRRGRARAPDSPMSAEHMGEACTPNAATRSRGRSAAKQDSAALRCERDQTESAPHQ
jgi:hypothetical protein